MSLNLGAFSDILKAGDAIAAASDTDSNSTRIDMVTGAWQGLIAICTITDCANTGVATMTLEDNTANSDTGMTAVPGQVVTATSAGDDDLNGKILILDTFRSPLGTRYVQIVRTSSVANIAFGELIVIKYRYDTRRLPLNSNILAATYGQAL